MTPHIRWSQKRRRPFTSHLTHTISEGGPCHYRPCGKHRPVCRLQRQANLQVGPALPVQPWRTRKEYRRWYSDKPSNSIKQQAQKCCLRSESTYSQSRKFLYPRRGINLWELSNNSIEESLCPKHPPSRSQHPPCHPQPPLHPTIPPPYLPNSA